MGDEKMKKVITAIGNKNLNQKLKEEKDFEIVTQDIPYQEGILEVLEQEKNINFLILSELLPGEIELKELIEKIKNISPNIQIILFLEQKNQELENYLYAKGIYFIFYHNQVKFSEIINLIKSEKNNSNEQLKKELDELKELLLEKENTKNEKINIFRKKGNIVNKKIKNNFNEQNYEEKDIDNKKNNIIDFEEQKEKIIKEQKEVICVSRNKWSRKEYLLY